ncbi:hypothetical protein C7H79_14615 [Nitrosomonas supralitoralis]|uniref:Uncharacterized protein n=1 Tax=Nitrosomonas supralitoralis TaxID=2116706 RepID=A0A2P7NRX2_9PROT|nr:hypothetical protein C7H79_14615 [Nitrosomonas supralitoralis]
MTIAQCNEQIQTFTINTESIERRSEKSTNGSGSDHEAAFAAQPPWSSVNNCTKNHYCPVNFHSKSIWQWLAFLSMSGFPRNKAMRSRFSNKLSCNNRSTPCQQLQSCLGEIAVYGQLCQLHTTQMIETMRLD